MHIHTYNCNKLCLYFEKHGCFVFSISSASQLRLTAVIAQKADYLSLRRVIIFFFLKNHPPQTHRVYKQTQDSFPLLFNVRAEDGLSLPVFLSETLYSFSF